MNVLKQTVTVNVDSSGDANVDSSQMTGKLISVRSIPDGTSPYAAGADFVITVKDSVQGVWTETDIGADAKTVAPRQLTHDLVGATSLYAGGGEAVRDHIHLAQEKLNFIVDEGGVSKLGTFEIIWEGTR